MLNPPRITPTPQPALGLALGGGGMKGWAHVGVLSVLDRYGLAPGVVSGSSIGALIGAFYAYGYPLSALVRFMREQQTTDLFSFRFDGVGLLDHRNLRSYLRQHLHDCTFADLQMPFYVLATDLESGREVVLRDGSVVEAILASSAMPGIFAPVEIDGRLLVDGGLCNNVPVSALVHHGARYTIAVQLHQDREGGRAVALRQAAAGAPETTVSISAWADRLSRRFMRSSRLPSGLEVVSRTLDIVIGQIERYRMQAYPADVLITPDVSHIRTLSFSEEKDSIFHYGVEAADTQAAALEQLARQLDAFAARQQADGPASAP